MTALYPSAGRNEKNGQSQFFGGGEMTLDKTLLSMDGSIGGLFLLVKGYLDRKAGAGDAIGKGRWSSGRSFEKSAHLLVESPVKRAFLSTIQAGLSCTPLFHDAL